MQVPVFQDTAFEVPLFGAPYEKIFADLKKQGIAPTVDILVQGDTRPDGDKRKPNMIPFLWRGTTLTRIVAAAKVCMSVIQETYDILFEYGTKYKGKTVHQIVVMWKKDKDPFASLILHMLKMQEIGKVLENAVRNNSDLQKLGNLTVDELVNDSDIEASQKLYKIASVAVFMVLRLCNIMTQLMTRTGNSIQDTRMYAIFLKTSFLHYDIAKPELNPDAGVPFKQIYQSYEEHRTMMVKHLTQLYLKRVQHMTVQYSVAEMMSEKTVGDVDYNTALFEFLLKGMCQKSNKTQTGLLKHTQLALQVTDTELPMDKMPRMSADNKQEWVVRNSDGSEERFPSYNEAIEIIISRLDPWLSLLTNSNSKNLPPTVSCFLPVLGDQESPYLLSQETFVNGYKHLLPLWSAVRRVFRVYGRIDTLADRKENCESLVILLEKITSNADAAIFWDDPFLEEAKKGIKDMGHINKSVNDIGGFNKLHDNNPSLERSYILLCDLFVSNMAQYVILLHTRACLALAPFSRMADSLEAEVIYHTLAHAINSNAYDAGSVGSILKSLSVWNKNCFESVSTTSKFCRNRPSGKKLKVKGQYLHFIRGWPYVSWEHTLRYFYLSDPGFGLNNFSKTADEPLPRELDASGKTVDVTQDTKQFDDALHLFSLACNRSNEKVLNQEAAKLGSLRESPHNQSDRENGGDKDKEYVQRLNELGKKIAGFGDRNNIQKTLEYNKLESDRVELLEEYTQYRNDRRLALMQEYAKAEGELKKLERRE
jgi:hypothetical protein